jgi:lipid II:glycine glycyltransferase (peptidoglycan interpeptide bridge formation enzyme)
MTEQEKKIIDRSIKSYKNMINYFKEQVVALERRKLKIHKKCPECISLDIINNRGNNEHRPDFHSERDDEPEEGKKD